MTNDRKARSACLLLIAGLALGGCAGKGAQEGTTEAAMDQESLTAVAELLPTEGNSVEGTVTFTKVEGGVHVVAELSGLTPGDHGFHIHETGDCSAPDASSAGGHFNPAGTSHAGPEAATRHAGDLGNITADPDGYAEYDRIDSQLSLEGPNTIVGRAVVVHASPDDLTSQPAGNAGARVACGVIELEQ